jgi:DNA-binding transcriptional MerR regulator
MTTAGELEADLTIQQVVRQTGLAESALRYYKRFGLIDAVQRDESRGHRRYPPALVRSVESLSCLRSTGMSVQDMRAARREHAPRAGRHGRPAPVVRRHAERLRAEIARPRMRERCSASLIPIHELAAHGAPGGTRTHAVRILRTAARVCVTNGNR